MNAAIVHDLFSSVQACPCSRWWVRFRCFHDNRNRPMFDHAARVDSKGEWKDPVIGPVKTREFGEVVFGDKTGQVLVAGDN